MKNLYLSKDVASDLLPVLKDVTGESTTELLPALEDLFFEEYQPPPKPVQKAIQKFTAVRRLADRRRQMEKVVISVGRRIIRISLMRKCLLMLTLQSDSIE